jgi:8-oxo-dGTP pyrophosphatase MutT (NUDIX family)
MRTWDGLPVSAEKPYGATVVVWREAATGGREFLLLHRRAAGGVDFEGEWAWTPPAGARLPDEPLREAARRELREETGLELAFEPIAEEGVEWALFVAKAPPEAEVVLDDEHDRFVWAPLDEAIARCLPRAVAEQFAVVAERLGPAART